MPSQIRALRLKSEMPRQADLARGAKMQQSRISMFETPGAANLTLETLSRIAAAFKVGVVVKFVPFSEMLAWENNFSQDQFEVTKIDSDLPFLNPVVAAQTIAPPATDPITVNLVNVNSPIDEYSLFSGSAGAIRVSIDGQVVSAFPSQPEEDLWNGLPYQYVPFWIDADNVP